MKRCNKCGISKVLTAYAKKKDSKTQKYFPRAVCRECNAQESRTVTQNLTPEQKIKRKEQFLKRSYGITMLDYNELFTTQQGRCPGCGKHQSELPKALVVDHDHITGVVRGLLCSGCNLAIGNVREKTQTLINLVEYLRSVQ